jgi:DNA-directed RNA polymerase specialized sigma24 family protein/ribosome-associated translation inhibitor RaiA
MKQLMNLSHVHEDVRNAIRAEASRRITRIDRRMKRFSDDLPQIHLIVRPAGEGGSQWETRLTLKISSHIIATQAVRRNDIQDSLKHAFDRLERRIQRHFKAGRRRRRLRRKELFHASMESLESEMGESVSAKENDIFDLILRPHFDHLRRFAGREIRNLEIRGVIPRESLTVMDVIDETLLVAWEEYRQKEEGLPTDLWVMQIVSRIMRKKAEESAEFIPLDAVVDEGLALDEEYDPDMDSDQWWWSQVQEQEDILWEDLLLDEKNLDALDALTYDEEKRRVLEALNRLPQFQREAISLHTMEGYDLPDVARILQDTTDNVKCAIEEARIQLRQHLGFNPGRSKEEGAKITYPSRMSE